jgi:hypothetical protein
VITYEVTAVVDASIADQYERYMRERHVPDLMATGCFAAADLTRGAAGRYRVRYEALTRESLDRYLREHAERLRAHFAETFPWGVRVEREEWEHVGHWTASTKQHSPEGPARDYRLHYPESLRATLHVDQPAECASAYAVIDIAERGLRYLATGAALRAGAVTVPPIGATVHGRFVTERGATPIPIAGTVVRRQDDEVALHLTLLPIPLSVFFSEQRRVLSRARHAL